MASIRKRAWKTPEGEVRTAWAVDWIDQTGTRHRRQFPTAKEARDYRTEIEHELRHGLYRPESNKVTVEHVAEAYLQYCKARSLRDEHMTPHTVKNHQGVIYNYVLAKSGGETLKRRHRRTTQFSAGIGNLKVGQLSMKRVGQFRDDLRAAGMSVAMTRRVISTLHGMLEYAKSQDIVSVNAVDGVRVIGSRDEGGRKIMPPSKEWLRAVIQEADADFRLLIEFAASTGVRAGELYALRWQDFDFETRRVHIQRRVDRYGNEGPPKTRAGKREIPLSDSLVTKMRSWRLRSPFSQDGNLVFPNTQGRYRDHYITMQRRFRPIFERLREARTGSERAAERFNWHALRHFAISTWIEAGLPPKTIQTFAGHSSLQVTMDRYGHLFPSQDHNQAMNTVARWLADS